MKRFLCVILALLMLLALFAGCAGGDRQSDGSSRPDSSKADASMESSGEESPGMFTASGYPIVNEPLTITGAMPDNQRKPYMENRQAEWLEAMTGIHIEMQVYASDVWLEKLGVMLAGGDYPEFLYMADMDRNAQMLYGRDSGTLIDLKPYVTDAIMPNFKSFADSNADIYRIACIDDGGLYALPFLMNGLNEPHFIVNRTWMDALGISAPATLDELTDMLRRFKNDDPNGNGEADEIAISSAGNIYWYQPMVCNFGIPAVSLLEDENGKVYHSATTQNYRDYLAWSAMLYKEGIIDSRVPTGAINDERILADMQKNIVGMLYTAYAALAVSAPEQYVGFVPVPYGDNATGVWPGSLTMVQGTFAVTDKCEYPEAILRWVDWQYSEAGQVMYYYGVEGETYELDETGTWHYINVPEGMSEVDYQNTFSIQGMHYYPGIYSYWATEHSSDPNDKQAQANRDALLPITVKTICEYSLTADEIEEISIASTDISNYIANCEAKFIAGELDVEKDWDEFLATLNAMGLEKVISVTQDAVDRFYGK